MKLLPLRSAPWILSLMLSAPAFAYTPEVQHIEHGEATVAQMGNHTEIHQLSNEAIIHWKNFDTASHETVHFNQPNAGSMVLNRITSGNPTQFYGKLTANGKVIIVNGAGITFGPGSTVNVGGLIASTADISNDNFLNKRFHFDKPGQPDAAVHNYGQIKVADNGLAALVGPTAANHGVIEARLGTVAIGSGDTVVMDFHGDQLINFVVDESLISAKSRKGKTSASQSEKGQIIADGGRVYVHAAAAHKVLDNVINMKGIVQARAVTQRNGVIILHAGPQGRVKVSGRLDASSRKARLASASRHAVAAAKVEERGGHIQVMAKDIHIESAHLDVSGHQGGGKISIGGQPEQKAYAETVHIAPNVIMHADTLEYGQGGQIHVAASQSLVAEGHMSASAGPKSQESGGLISTESDGYLNVNQLTVNLSSLNGELGTWQLKGQDLIVQATSEPKYTGRGKQKSYIDSNALQDNLTRANIALESLPSDAHSGDLIFKGDFTWANSSALTLKAYRNIDLYRKISNHQGGSLFLESGTTNTNGSLNFFGVEFNNLDIQGGKLALSLSYPLGSEMPDYFLNALEPLKQHGTEVLVSNQGDPVLVPDPQKLVRAFSDEDSDWEHGSAFSSDDEGVMISKKDLLHSSEELVMVSAPQHPNDWQIVYNEEEGKGSLLSASHPEEKLIHDGTVEQAEFEQEELSSSIDSILTDSFASLTEKMNGNVITLGSAQATNSPSSSLSTIPSLMGSLTASDMDNVARVKPGVTNSPTSSLSVVSSTMDQVTTSDILSAPTLDSSDSSFFGNLFNFLPIVAAAPIVANAVEPVARVQTLGFSPINPDPTPAITSSEPTLPTSGAGFGKHKGQSKAPKKHLTHWHWAQEEEEEAILIHPSLRLPLVLVPPAA